MNFGQPVNQKNTAARVIFVCEHSGVTLNIHTEYRQQKQRECLTILRPKTVFSSIPVKRVVLLTTNEVIIGEPINRSQSLPHPGWNDGVVIPHCRPLSLFSFHFILFYFLLFYFLVDTTGPQNNFSFCQSFFFLFVLPVITAFPPPVQSLYGYPLVHPIYS